MAQDALRPRNRPRVIQHQLRRAQPEKDGHVNEQVTRQWQDPSIAPEKRVVSPGEPRLPEHACEWYGEIVKVVAESAVVEVDWGRPLPVKQDIAETEVAMDQAKHVSARTERLLRFLQLTPKRGQRTR